MKWFSAVHYSLFPGHTVAIKFLRYYLRNLWHYSYAMTAMFFPCTALCRALAHLSVKGNGFGRIKIFMEGHEQAAFGQKQFPLYPQTALSKKWIASPESQIPLRPADFCILKVKVSCFRPCVSQQIGDTRSDIRFTLENNWWLLYYFLLVILMEQGTIARKTRDSQE